MDRGDTPTDVGMLEWFRREQGGNSDYVVHKGWFIFRNTARLCQNSPLWYGALPDDGSRDVREQRYQIQRTFFTVKLQDAKERYETLKTRMETDAQRCVKEGLTLPFGQEEVKLLKRLKVALRIAQLDYDKFTAKDRENARNYQETQLEYRSANVADASKMLREIESL